eukprot:5622-Heterococcus_DN1.PRE.1
MQYDMRTAKHATVQLPLKVASGAVTAITTEVMIGDAAGAEVALFSSVSHSTSYTSKLVSSITALSTACLMKPAAGLEKEAKQGASLLVYSTKHSKSKRLVTMCRLKGARGALLIAPFAYHIATISCYYCRKAVVVDSRVPISITSSTVRATECTYEAEALPI